MHSLRLNTQRETSTLGPTQAEWMAKASYYSANIGGKELMSTETYFADPT